jgi:hypothetical protein
LPKKLCWYKVRRGSKQAMPDINRKYLGNDLEKQHDAEYVQSGPVNVNNTHYVEQDIVTLSDDVFLRKLDKVLSNPIHRRLLDAYARRDTNTAKESMEYELSHILLEVLDHVD